MINAAFLAEAVLLIGSMFGHDLQGDLYGDRTIALPYIEIQTHCNAVFFELDCGIGFAHMSHPFVGWPINDKYEDTFNMPYIKFEKRITLWK